MILNERRKKFILMLFSLPKSIIFNFCCLPIKQAIKIPVLVSYRCKIYCLYRGCIEIRANDIHFGMFKIGFGGTYGIQPISHTSIFEVSKSGRIIINGNVNFAESCSLRVGGGARIRK